jgi:hypothetical protein
MHSNSVQNTRATINTAGVYLVTGNASFLGTATGIRVLHIYVNGASRISASGDADGSQTDRGLAQQFLLSVADYVELYVYHTQGTDSTLTSQKFSITRITGA